MRNQQYDPAAVQPVPTEQVAGWVLEPAGHDALPIRTLDHPAPSLVTMSTTHSRLQVCGIIEKGLLVRCPMCCTRAVLMVTGCVPPTVGCPPLLIEYIRIYLTHLEVVSSRFTV